MAHRIRPHPERSRRTHDAGSKIASLFAQYIEIELILEVCECRALSPARRRKDRLEKIRTPRNGVLARTSSFRAIGRRHSPDGKRAPREAGLSRGCDADSGERAPHLINMRRSSVGRA